MLAASAKGLCLPLLATAAVALSACGGTSSPAGTSSSASVADASVRGAHAAVSHDTVTTGVVTHRPLDGTGGSEINDDNPGNADSGDDDAGNNDPCDFVSRAAAQAILGSSIHAPSEAPLGPTCIYQAVGSKSTVTVAIQATSFAATRSHIGALRPIEVSGHRAYCGGYGQPSTFLPLPGGRVLDVTGPCAIGKRFAAKALQRLES